MLLTSWASSKRNRRLLHDSRTLPLSSRQILFLHCILIVETNFTKVDL